MTLELPSPTRRTPSDIPIRTATPKQQSEGPKFTFLRDVVDAPYFAFTAEPPIPINIAFPLARCPPTLLSPKRIRSLSDIDGENSALDKKKRRLRLQFVTSRLSRPFSSPATNIIDRKFIKGRPRTKSNPFGGAALRKVAILNSMRKNIENTRLAPVLQQEQMEMVMRRLVGLFRHFEHNTYTDPKITNVRAETESPNQTPGSQPIYGRDYAPLPPSPLGVSHYDLLDEEEAYEDYRDAQVNWDDDADDEETYSDWSAFDVPEESAVDEEEEEFTDAFTNVMPELVVRERRGSGL